MLQVVVPRLAKEIGDRYKDIAAHAGIRLPYLYAYIGMIFWGCSNLCGFSRLAGWITSVSAVSRQLQNFDADVQNALLIRHRWHYLKEVRKSPDEYFLVIDTTKNLKRTFGVEGIGRWGDSNGSVFMGQNLLVVALIHQESGAAIPLIYLPCLKPSERKDNTTANHRVVEALDLLRAEKWPNLIVTLDSWFDSPWLMEQLSERNITFVVDLRSSRKPKISPGHRAKKHLLMDIFAGLERVTVVTGTRTSGRQSKKFISEKIIWISGSSKDSKQIQLKACAVYNNFDDGKGFRYYATNDLSRAGVWLWKMSRGRWNIEVMFRDLKQHLAFGKFAAKTPFGVNMSLVIPILVMGHLRRHDYTTPIATLLERERQKESVRNIFSTSTELGFRRLNIVKNRLDPARANKKPVSTAAEKENGCMSYKKCA